MSTHLARKLSTATGLAAALAGAAICLAATGMINSPSANAGSSQSTAFPTAKAGTAPPAMNASVSSDEKIDTGGTQGSFKAAMDGIVRSGPQCDEMSSKVACETQSPEVVPQYKAK